MAALTPQGSKNKADAQKNLFHKWGFNKDTGRGRKLHKPARGLQKTTAGQARLLNDDDGLLLFTRAGSFSGICRSNSSVRREVVTWFFFSGIHVPVG